MKMTLMSTCWATVLLVIPQTLLALDLKTASYKGCFSSADGFEDQGSYTYQSPGYCQEQCVGINKPVMALAGGSNCWCGDLLPVASNKVSDSDCSTECQGYPDDKCGGDNSWTVSLTGLKSNVENAQDSSSDSDSKPKPAANPPSSTAAPRISTSTVPSPAAKAKPTTVLVPVPQVDSINIKEPATLVSTVVVTGPTKTQAAAASADTLAPALAPAPAPAPAKSTNTPAIAAGVVAGVVAVCAIAGGLFFVLRRRKRRAAEEEYQRNSANPFENEASHPPASSHSMSDSRLEPSVMMQRRQSDVSIADNQDYSRRILKVTNPDGT
ncbi:MAG: hypothetical protein Q9183_000527 [Haloplaca sp. 2 TL-2023]